MDIILDQTPAAGNSERPNRVHDDATIGHATEPAPPTWPPCPPPCLKPPGVRQIADGLRLYIAPGQVAEARFLGVQDDARFPPAVWAGFFDASHLPQLAEIVRARRETAEGMYVTLNPIDPELLANARNRVKPVKRGPDAGLTKDEDILRRTRFLVDVDPIRYSGNTGKRLRGKVSSTDAERETAWVRLHEVIGFLAREVAFPPPGIVGDSGNGFNATWEIDLPADDGGLIATALKALAARFSDDKAEVDPTVANAARITKIFGSRARKGDASEDRPHRYAWPVRVEKSPVVLTRELLEALAGLAPAPPEPAPAPGPTNGPTSCRRGGMPAAERAERYVLSDDFPASIEGSRGHGPLYRAACELVDGFALTRAEAWPILQKYNAEKAHPPETDHQLNHKLDDAIKHHPVPSRKRLDAPPKAGPPPRPPGGDASRNGHHDGPAVGGLWAPGTPVQALDRGNFGHVVEDHGATASVHFVSPSGREHTRTFSKAELVKAGENSHAAGPPGDAPPPEPFRLGLTGSREFFGTAYTLAWHVTKLLVKGEPCVLGGPSKSLKTSVAIDLAVSLATATRFLGRFEVPAPARVILISGESGRPIIQANARAVCAARGIADPAGMEGLLWGFTLPQLTVAEHMDALRAAIVEHRAEVVIVDPFYMTLPADVDPKNMFMMGPVLSAYAEGCLALGATPVLLHHFTKKRDDPTAPPDMAELAFAGIAQWMRQWMLLARRTPFRPEEAVHSMFFCYGGSAGHCGELHLDIDTGRIDEDFGGRRWDVRITTPGEGMTQEREQHRADQLRKEEERAREAEERKARQARDDAGRMHRTMLELDRPETLSRIRGMVNLSGDRALAAVLHLEREGLARRAAVTVRTGTGAREVEGYEATTVSPF